MVSGSAVCVVECFAYCIISKYKSFNYKLDDRESYNWGNGFIGHEGVLY